MRYSSLDALRGIGCIIVVLQHSTFYTAGEQSAFLYNCALLIDLFFIVSGFVIAMIYQQRLGHGISGRRFLWIRLGRLYPLHVAVLLLWVPWVLAKYIAFQQGIGRTDPTLYSNGETFLYQLLMLQGIGPFAGGGWNYPAWTISTEMLAYLAFLGGVLYLRALLATVWFPLLLAVGSYGALALMFPAGDMLSTSTWAFLRCLGGFFAGVTVWQLARRQALRLDDVRLASALEVLLLAACVWLISMAHHGIACKLAALVALTLFVLVLVSQDRGLVSRAFQWKPLLQLGEWSYSIYMVHALFVVVSYAFAAYVLKLPVGTAVNDMGGQVNAIRGDWSWLANTVLLLAVVATSALTYRWIEQPWRERFRRQAEKW